MLVIYNRNTIIISKLGYDLPWEDRSFTYPDNFANPLEIIIEASNGASDYGNKFGEPVISGFARSFGLNLKDGRKEWIKPIMFSGGIGCMDDNMIEKQKPEKGKILISPASTLQFTVYFV